MIPPLEEVPMHARARSGSQSLMVAMLAAAAAFLAPAAQAGPAIR